MNASFVGYVYPELANKRRKIPRFYDTIMRVDIYELAMKDQFALHINSVNRFLSHLTRSHISY